MNKFSLVGVNGNYDTLLCLLVSKIEECNARLGLTDEDEDDE